MFGRDKLQELQSFSGQLALVIMRPALVSLICQLRLVDAYALRNKSLRPPDIDRPREGGTDEKLRQD